MVRCSVVWAAAIVMGFALAACEAGSPAYQPPRGAGDAGTASTDQASEYATDPAAGSGDAAIVDPGPSPREEENGKPDERTDGGRTASDDGGTSACAPDSRRCGCGGPCEASITWGELVWTARFGNADSGDALVGEVQCPENYVAVGLYGKSGWYIDRLGVVCRPLEVSQGRDRGLQVVFPDGDEKTGALAGGGALADGFELTCPRGTIMDGISGKAGIYIDQLEVHCSELTAERGDVRAGTGSFVKEPTDAKGPVGGTGGEEFGPGRCPAGSLMTGLEGAWDIFLSGKIVNMVRLQCQEASIELD